MKAARCKRARPGRGGRYNLASRFHTYQDISLELLPQFHIFGFEKIHIWIYVYAIYMCVYIYIHICVYIHIYIYICIYTHIYMNVSEYR